MGLFSNKNKPCPLCGEATPRLLPTKIEGQPICSACDVRMDMQAEIKNDLTLSEAREHMAFLDQNQSLRDSFQISEKLDFGFFGYRIIFDYQNRLFCMSGKPDKTIFEADALISFSISEDQKLLFEGSLEGLKQYESAVPDRIAALAPQITMSALANRMAAQQAREDRENDRPSYRQRIDITEPFRQFNVKIKLKHPYWREFSFHVDGPTFDNDYPDVDDYLREYMKKASEMETLAMALMNVGFPGFQTILCTADGGTARGAASPAGSGAEEIKKFKELLDTGILTQEEFDAKKKQLLGL